MSSCMSFLSPNECRWFNPLCCLACTRCHRLTVALAYCLAAVGISSPCVLSCSTGGAWRCVCECCCSLSFPSSSPFSLESVLSLFTHATAALGSMARRPCESSCFQSETRQKVVRSGASLFVDASACVSLPSCIHLSTGHNIECVCSCSVCSTRPPAPGLSAITLRRSARSLRPPPSSRGVFPFLMFAAACLVTFACVCLCLVAWLRLCNR